MANTVQVEGQGYGPPQRERERKVIKTGVEINPQVASPLTLSKL